MVPCKSTAEGVSFEWSHHWILSTESKVRTTLYVFIIDSGSVKGLINRLECVNTIFLMFQKHLEELASHGLLNNLQQLVRNSDKCSCFSDGPILHSLSQLVKAL